MVSIMKRLVFLMVILSLAALTLGFGNNWRNEIGFYGHLNRTCIPHRGGTAYLQIEVNTPSLPSQSRKPMNLAVVLDRSGSMADAKKIDYA